MMSPDFKPDPSDGPPGVTCSTLAPVPPNDVSKLTPMIGVLAFPVSMISSEILLAWLMGIEKPKPMDPASS